MPEKVVVIGGGVAGLTAAHELIEKGFEVHLYERRERLGGKSASVTAANGLPGEHGFRFFPGWYRHLPDTMRRIPYKNRTVAHNLVPATESLFASYKRDAIPALLRFPRSLKDIVTLAGFPAGMLKAGLTSGDLLFFFGKLAQFAACPEALRPTLFETQTWWQFMDADRRSEQFRAYLVDGITRNTVAASPKQASALTIATVALRTLMDAVKPGGSHIDRVLNGPSSDVWIQPWVEDLEEKGVKFHLDAELDSIDVKGCAINSVRFMLHGLEIRRLRARLDAMRIHLDATPVASGVDRSTEAVRANDKLEALGASSNALYNQETREADMEALEKALRESDSGDVSANYFVFALPIEQMAYYVQRSEMLKRKDESLINIVRLSNHVEWMAGIQFYLTKDVEITHGHVDCLDSEWALTAISQAQFWSEVDFAELGDEKYRNKVKTILSVDISAWNVPGGSVVHRKEAFSCTREEVAKEVWDQLKKSLNRSNNAPVLRDNHLLGWNAGATDLPKCSYYLDEEIVDRFDRKKQAFYKKYESVRFSSEAVAERLESDSEVPTLFAHGSRLTINAEPLFINRANTLHLRPGVKTKLENMLLAADYVKTNTNLATMEAANEAARLAVNEILTMSGSKHAPCEIWSLAPPTDLVASLASFASQPTSAGGNLGGASLSARAAGMLQDTARKAFDGFVSRRR